MPHKGKLSSCQHPEDEFALHLFSPGLFRDEIPHSPRRRFKTDKTSYSLYNEEALEKQRSLMVTPLTRPEILVSKIREIVSAVGSDNLLDKTRKFSYGDLKIIRSREGGLRAIYGGLICLTAPMPGDTSDQIHIYCSNNKFFDLVEYLHQKVNGIPIKLEPFAK